MTKREMKSLARNLRDEIKKYEEQNVRRPTRESRGRAEAYKNCGELLDAMMDCWRWL